VDAHGRCGNSAGDLAAVFSGTIAAASQA
jgi:hypothetical protein